MLGWLGWTIVYAVVVWGIDAAYALLERWLNVADRRVQGVAAGVRFLLPLGVAFVTVDLLRRPSSERQQAGAGWILAIGATVLDAAMATLAAVAGVAIGRWWHGG